MPSFQDLTGLKFNRLLVKGRAPDKIQPSGQHCRMWWCVCDCGNECIVSGQNLKSGHTKSCGCLFTETTSERNLDNFAGRKFGKVLVIERSGSQKHPSGTSDPVWLCECECGKKFVTHSSSLRSGRTISCGCSKRIDLTGKRFYRLTAVERAPDRIDINGISHTMWKCVCDCGKETVKSTQALQSGGAKSCGCVGSSVAELEIESMLQKLGIHFTREKSFKDLKSSNSIHGYPRFDFAILDNENNILGLIEFQGPHHYIERFRGWGDVQRLVTDPLKRKYCKSHNIPLLEISYTEDYAPCIIKFLEDLNALYANPVPSLGNEEGVTTIP